MIPPAVDVTDAELSVLQVLWERGPTTRRGVADVLYPGGGPTQYGTVQKLLERLETKACVAKEDRGGQWLFRAVVDRDGVIGRRLLDVAERLCGGATAPLLMNLVRAKPLTPDEVRELQEYLASLHRKR